MCVEEAARRLLEDYYKYPEGLTDSFAAEFVDAGSGFTVDDLRALAAEKLELISDAVRDGAYGDDFVASLYQQDELGLGTVEHASMELLVEYLRCSEDFTDGYVREFIRGDDSCGVDQLRATCCVIGDTIADRIADRYRG